MLVGTNRKENSYEELHTEAAPQEAGMACWRALLAVRKAA
jgi:hypothetical protein